MKHFSKAVKIWLITGCVLLFFQVVIGGITRITGSGLSITKWEIVTGTLPPLSSADWEEAFDLYKETPQYKKINDGMSMSDFKFIYFWEFFHRFWARAMGFIFLFPFLYFLWKKAFDKKLLRSLAYVFILAVLAASMGWIMVASGLLDRPWVNAYKLALHLSVALSCFGVLVWTTYYAFQPNGTDNVDYGRYRKYWRYFLGVLAVQIFIGGVMSGMKAGIYYPSWPDMNGEIVPSLLWKSQFWNVESFNLYDQYPLVPALVQSVHRLIAYLLFFSGLYLFIKQRSVVKFKYENLSNNLFISLLISQVVLGILTVINCVGEVPLFYGVMHQAFAMLLLMVTLYINYLLSAD
jgi:cytochrome c oxidase assembly protein subunit 15